MSVNSRVLLIMAAVLCGSLIGGVPVEAVEAEITMVDGREFSGRVESQNDHTVTILIAGIPTSIDRSDIKTLELVDSIDDTYRKKRSELADDDLDGRYKLARWLFDKNALQLANVELKNLASQFPNDERVKMLHDIVVNRLKVEDRVKSISSSPKQDDSSQTQKPVSKRYQLAESRMTDEQVNLIRVYELDENLMESRPKIVIPKPVIDRFLEEYREYDITPKGKDEVRKFRAAPGYEQLDVLFAAKARNLYSQVEVRQEPQAMMEFRQAVHPQLVLRYCASCHSTEQPNSMYLFDILPTTDRTVYTNFYILTQYRNKDGWMIDRDRPERSLLLQYALSGEIATTPHPAVDDWRPEFFGLEDPHYQKIEQWIGKLYLPRPEYGIEYIPPFTKPLSGSAANPEVVRNPGQ